MQAIIRSAAIAFLLLGPCQSNPAQNQDSKTHGLPPKSDKDKAPPPQDRIDINHASLNALLKVPGMTPSWAARIIRFRPYHSKADLLENGIVTPEVYSRIKDYVIAHRDPQ